MPDAPSLPAWVQTLLAWFPTIFGVGGLIGWYQVWQQRKKVQAEAQKITSDAHLSDAQTNRTEAEVGQIQAQVVASIMGTAKLLVDDIGRQREKDLARIVELENKIEIQGGTIRSMGRSLHESNDLHHKCEERVAELEERLRNCELKLKKSTADV